MPDRSLGTEDSGERDQDSFVSLEEWDQEHPVGAGSDEEEEPEDEFLSEADGGYVELNFDPDILELQELDDIPYGDEDYE